MKKNAEFREDLYTRIQDDSILDNIFNIFSNRNIEIEIGCGHGHFLSDYSKCDINTLYMGIDLKKSRCEKALKKQSGKNTIIICGRAEACLERVPENRIDKYHIYFPDPWPKSRHRKRRFFRKEHLCILYKTLKKGGELFFASDMTDYYIQAKVLLSLHGGFLLRDELPHDTVHESMFSKRFAGSGKEVHFITAEKI